MKMAERNRAHTHRHEDVQPAHQHPNHADRDAPTERTILARQRRAREQVRRAKQQARWREREAIVTQRTADTQRNDRASGARDYRWEVA